MQTMVTISSIGHSVRYGQSLVSWRLPEGDPSAKLYQPEVGPLQRARYRWVYSDGQVR